MKNLLPIVCGRGGGIGLHENNAYQSNGADTIATYRICTSIVTTAGNITGLQVELANIIGEGVSKNDVTRQLSLVVLDTLYPVTFAGKPTVTLAPGDAGVLSDIISIPTLRPGDTVYCIDCVRVLPGGVWALGNPTVSLTGDGMILGVNAARSNTGMSAADAYASSPVCIRGVSSTTMPGGAVIIGDSIAAGQGDVAHELGFAVRACNNAGVGFVRIALPGELASQFLSNHLQRGQLLSSAPYHIHAYGTNDVMYDRTVAQIKADFIASWVLSRRHGAKFVDQCTIPPGEFTGAREAVRTTINNWLRSGDAIRENPTLLSQVTDRAAAVEATSDGGPVSIGGEFWAANMKQNFLHPNANGHIAMANTFSLETLAKPNVSSLGVLSQSDLFYGYNARHVDDLSTM